MCNGTLKRRCCEVEPWRPHKLRLPLLTPFFHKHSHQVFSVLLYVISESRDTDFAPQVVYKPRVLSVSSEHAHANYSYFDTCSRLHASAASACNWAGHCAFNVMVLKCTQYTTRITLNVTQSGCTVAFQLGFEPGSLVWRAGSLPIKPSGPAWYTKKKYVWIYHPIQIM